MYSYFAGIFWIILNIFIIYIIGNALCDKEDAFSKKILLGYVIFTAIGSIPGIICQLLEINVKIYYVVYSILIICLVGFSIYKTGINQVSKEEVIKHIKNNYVIYIVSFLLVLLSVINIEGQWLANNLDDGRYLLLSANYSRLANPYTVNPATGLISGSAGIIRSINTFELENSFWISLLNIEATVYTRVFLSFFNYYIFINGIKYFIDIIKKQFDIKHKHLLQFATIAVLILMITPDKLNNLLYMQDAWQFQTAMWYGSSIVRMCTFFLCLTPIIEKEKIELNSIIYYIFVSVALVSRATQALPLLFVISIAYLAVMQKSIRNIVICLLAELLILYFMPVLYSNQEGIYQICEMTIQTNMSSILFISSLIIIIGAYFTKNMIVIRWNSILLLSSLFIFSKFFNSMVLNLSQYDFVVARSMTTVTVTLLCTAAVYFSLLILWAIRKYWGNLVVFVGIASILLCFIKVSNQNEIGYRHRAKILINNIQIMPESILNISNQLDLISAQEKLTVISPAMVYENQALTAFATILRIDAPDIISLSAKPRYPEIQDHDTYGDYTQSEQEIMEQFVRGNIYDFDKEVNEMIDKYRINCFISMSEITNKYLEEMDFRLEYDYSSETNHFYIYVNYQ